ncbi:putative membrane protein [Kitasatospora sp. MAA4]|uniref:SHOCT domain-containing protein n=1 Tax=Kitasatospora sp. MAA4 TaxID=3035093 RepID=UPI0024758C8C|nr:SHOCT domain-containing protein [Kitasatospora sp. MAA4]MDH6136454.1 putative membrane protein [Kitasatospora sp. MAA4]
MNATTVLLADHGWPHGAWFLLFPLGWLVFLVIVFAVLRRTVWRRRGCYGMAWGGGSEGPLAVLGRRYAQGEIDEEEYRARRSVLIERGKDDS